MSSASNEARRVVLVYSDEGVGPVELDQTKHYLNATLPDIDVRETSASEVLDGALSESVALLIMPGGADAAYVRRLGASGAAAIRSFVFAGGSYLGICAGGYFGSSFCDFERGTPLEIREARDLALFAGKAVGSAFGYSYRSTRHAKAAPLVLAPRLASEAGVEVAARAPVLGYVNGGCFFEGACDHEVLACFADGIGGKADGHPAIVEGTFGKGRWILMGVHLEFDPHRLISTKYHDALRPALLATDVERSRLMAHLLQRLLAGSIKRARL
eukprot:TRINITY_DN5545_c2_g1_i1.p1 TRINITY_DN5545_c2_g1~~TRINITY_DN5545_c2_g1_i1.p1  ORF type:complete len:290 (-),score=47.92 TRINITY_DN5545_c2_g1_i1:214-1029(-)